MAGGAVGLVVVLAAFYSSGSGLTAVAYWVWGIGFISGAASGAVVTLLRRPAEASLLARIIDRIPDGHVFPTFIYISYSVTACRVVASTENASFLRVLALGLSAFIAVLLWFGWYRLSNRYRIRQLNITPRELEEVLPHALRYYGLELHVCRHGRPLKPAFTLQPDRLKAVVQEEWLGEEVRLCEVRPLGPNQSVAEIAEDRGLSPELVQKLLQYAQS
jgi:hypothetical protein